MEKEKVFDVLKKEWEKIDENFVAYFGNLFRRVHTLVVKNSKSYRELEAIEQRHLAVLSDYDSNKDKLDELTARVEGYKRTEEVHEGDVIRLTRENQRLGNDLEKALSKNAEIILSGIGLRRDYEVQRPLIEKLQAEIGHLKTSERISLRKQYDMGAYKNRAVLVTDADSKIIVQNLASRRLLGHFGKIRLTDYMPITEDKPQIVEFGDDIYRFSFTPINDGYEVEVEKEKSSFFKSSKAPHILNIQKIPTSVLVPAT